MHVPRSLHGALFVLVTALLGGCRDGAEAPASSRSGLAERAELELLEGQHPQVRAEIDGAWPVVLLIDTGAEYTVLSEHFAQKHDLPLEPFAVRAGPSSAPGRPIEHVAFVRELRFGAATVPFVSTARDGVSPKNPIQEP